MRKKGLHALSNALGRTFLLLVFLSIINLPVSAQGLKQSSALVLSVQGALVPTHLDYIKRGLNVAMSQKSEVVIIELDTPGGSIELMNEIVKTIRSSVIPVVVYVSPRGAMAGSAGTLITLSGHVAAMAPETTIGAASPVGSQGEDIGETMESKVKELLKASVRSITANRSKEAQKIAEETIEKARAVTANEALDVGLVDIQATDLEDLLIQLDKRTIKLDSREVVINTREAKVEKLEKTFIESFLQLLTNPNILFLLLSIGVQAILIEISSPGGWAAGFIGAVCLIVAFYGMGLLPVNWTGILFLIAAFVLFILDIKAPTHGALTIAGVVSFIMGALILFNTARVPGFPEVSVPLVIGVGIFIGLSFFAIVTIALRAQTAPVMTGREILPGQMAIVIGDMRQRGQVRAGGESWSAEQVSGDRILQDGEQVEIVAIDGLRLKIKKRDS